MTDHLLENFNNGVRIAHLDSAVYSMKEAVKCGGDNLGMLVELLEDLIDARASLVGPARDSMCKAG